MGEKEFLHDACLPDELRPPQPTARDESWEQYTAIKMIDELLQALRPFAQAAGRRGGVCDSMSEEKITKAADIEANTPITAGSGVETNEQKAERFRQEVRKGVGRAEGTEESLGRCASMLDVFSKDLYPANEQGQVHFARAMMESVADEIREYFRKKEPVQ